MDRSCDYRARYYSPTLQRFVSEDPLRESAGPNEYLYAENSPSNFMDPSGLKLIAKGDIDSVWLAISYLGQDPLMAMVIQDLIDSPTSYYITTIPYPDDGTTLVGNIDWDPHAGFTCSGSRGQEGALQSPALALGHELVHLSRLKNLGAISVLGNQIEDAGAYDNMEEKIIIQGLESHLAMTLGEGIRHDHHSRPTRVDSPLTKPKCKCARPEQSGYPWPDVSR